MLNPEQRLTELVRLLEERGHIFRADPQAATEAVRDLDASGEQKLLRRADIIDRDGRLRETLQQAAQSAAWLRRAAAVLLFAGGFVSVYALMDTRGVNFFLLLAGVLGMNTLMLVLWLLSLLWRGTVRVPFQTSGWRLGKDEIGQAAARLFAEEWRQPSARWRAGAVSHGLWLATLGGMLAAVLLLLLVRQYTFNWESTLLGGHTLAAVIAALSKLPAALGFPVPDADAVWQGRVQGNVDDARAWAGLLVGSMAVYGILPRLAAWLACRMMAKRAQQGLPLALPYYQNLMKQWHTRVVDEDTQQERVETVRPKIRIGDADKWAVLLDGAWPDNTWFAHVLGQNWHDCGTAAERDELAALETRLQANKVQLLIGVRARTVPDRGVLRRLVRLADAAAGGALVQLLLEPQTDVSDGLEEVLAHWRQALAERNLAWLEPPEFSQQVRQAERVESNSVSA